MNRIVFLLLIALSTSCFAKDVYVEGYTRSNGTQVQGHYRSSPDSTINNNFSTQGNVNPYTGEEGWIKREHEETTISSKSALYSSSNEPIKQYSPNPEHSWFKVLLLGVFFPILILILYFRNEGSPGRFLFLSCPIIMVALLSLDKL